MNIRFDNTSTNPQDLADMEQARRFVESLVETKIKQFSNIDKAREGIFGKGLMNSLAHNERGSEKRLEHTFDWFRNWRANNTFELEKFNSTEREYGKTLVENNSLTAAEFNTLAPANETTASAGGYTVPIEFAKDLSRNLGDYSLPRQKARVVMLGSNPWKMAGLATKPSVAVTAEGAAITASKPVLDVLTLTPKKAAALYAATNELLQDANIETYAVILDIFAELFGILESQSYFQNANTNWPGLLWYGAGAITSGVAANGAIAVSRKNSSTGGATGYPQIGDAAGATDFWGDLLLMQQAGLANVYYEGGEYYIDQNVLVAAISYRATQGQFLGAYNSLFEMRSGLNGDKQELFFAGYKICPVPSGIMLTYDASAHVSTPFTILANLKRCYSMMGLRGGFIAEQFREGTVDSVSAVENDLGLLRMKERIAFGVGRPNTMITLRTDAS